MSEDTPQPKPVDDWDYLEKRVYGHHTVGYLNDTVWFNRRDITTLSDRFIRVLDNVLNTYTTPRDVAATDIVSFVDTYKSFRANASHAGRLDLAVAEELADLVIEHSTREAVSTLLNENKTKLGITGLSEKQIAFAVESITAEAAVKFVFAKLFDDQTQKMRTLVDGDRFRYPYDEWAAKCFVRINDVPSTTYQLPHFAAGLLFYMAYRNLISVRK